MEQLANTDLHLISDFTSPEMSRYLGAGMDLFYKSLEDQNIPAVSNNKAFVSSDRIFYFRLGPRLASEGVPIFTHQLQDLIDSHTSRPVKN